jgi:hypothetical protein
MSKVSRVDKEGTKVATTVSNLIEYLNTIEDKEQPIFYQYVLAEHTEYDVETFTELVELAEDSSADTLTEVMTEALAEAQAILEEEN